MDATDSDWKKDIAEVLKGKANIVLDVCPDYESFLRFDNSNPAVKLLKKERGNLEGNFYYYNVKSQRSNSIVGCTLPQSQNPMAQLLKVTSARQKKLQVLKTLRVSLKVISKMICRCGFLQKLCKVMRRIHL